MNALLPPDWLTPSDLKAASAAQREIAILCETEDRFGPVRMVAGADTSMKWRDSRGPIHAAFSPKAWPPEQRALAPVSVTMVPAIPYVPGYLGFRECPALVAAWDLLSDKPDLIFVDGQGRSHPRRCGIATHLGVVLDVPTIGCAKSILCGKVEGELGDEAGSIAPLVDRGEVVGMALRTRARCQPIYVSSGHRISLATAFHSPVRSNGC